MHQFMGPLAMSRLYPIVTTEVHLCINDAVNKSHTLLEEFKLSVASLIWYEGIDVLIFVGYSMVGRTMLELTYGIRANGPSDEVSLLF